QPSVPADPTAQPAVPADPSTAEPAVPADPSTAQPQMEAAAKDEVFGVTSVISLPDSQKLGSFDISFVDPAHGVYLLADRTNKAVHVANTSTNTLTAALT